MNNVQIDFSIPTRQSYVAVLMIMWKRGARLFSALLPILAALLFGYKNTNYLYIGLACFVSIVVLISLLHFWFFYFYINDNELIVKKGVLKKSVINIPFDRIQSVHFEQNLLLQLFNNYKVQIETAGTSKLEFSFDALDRKKAEALREQLLAKTNFSDYSKVENNDSTNTEVIERHTILNLLKIGISENHLRALVWVFALIAYANSFLSDLRIDIYDILFDEMKSQFEQGIIVVSRLLLLSTIALLLISLVRTVLRYYDLKFERGHDVFLLQGGLINRREQRIADSKIQMLIWGDNPLRRLFGIFIITLKQAKSDNRNARKAFRIPVMQEYKVDQTLRLLYHKDVEQLFYSHSVSFHYFIFNYLYGCCAPLLACLICSIWFGEIAIYIGILVAVVYCSWSFLAWKKASVLYNKELLIRKRGVFGNRYEVLPWYKVQTVELRSSFYQRRNNLSTIVVSSAAGVIKIPFLNTREANRICDYGLYKAESSKTSWM